MEETRTVTKRDKKRRQSEKQPRNVKRAVAVSKPPQIGSAAADWSRWPAGTVFRLLSTGQNYRVEDYGWALSGRNTIDLYMANQREMNKWGARAGSDRNSEMGRSAGEPAIPAPPPGLQTHQAHGA